MRGRRGRPGLPGTRGGDADGDHRTRQIRRAAKAPRPRASPCQTDRSLATRSASPARGNNDTTRRRPARREGKGGYGASLRGCAPCWLLTAHGFPFCHWQILLSLLLSLIDQRRVQREDQFKGSRGRPVQRDNAFAAGCDQRPRKELLKSAFDLIFFVPFRPETDRTCSSVCSTLLCRDDIRSILFITTRDFLPLN